MSMKINITAQAMQFLQNAQKRELHIERFVVTDCCVPLSTPPAIRKGRPRKVENFHTFEVDGITVYYDRDLIPKSEITIDIQGHGFIKGLNITDWLIN